MLVFLPGEAEIMQVKKALEKERVGEDDGPGGGRGVGGSSSATSTSYAASSAGDGQTPQQPKPLACETFGWDIKVLHSRIPWEDMQ